ncbi:polysaccharide biosynthesis tyrosine autokinase [Anabaena sphaerica FACHB-251]|uniref:non-specific protein-tyrosine kinase n=1 Tax=Anabaena sphaerica FACHB-251 TaxID=2692883 RepID=A0A927A2M7_9NOST|nr:polysaccharide biosynthesis tyrosine autokinase [Anabaena sphaerica]MBD2295924.1 polysaccharide biosynthesis tyrosine autokinase [Anabaena sphaerica FACHB-251]
MDSNNYTEEIDFHQYWLVLKRRFPPAVGLFSVVVLLFASLANFQKSSYEVQGKLLFKVDRTSSLIGVGKDAQDIPMQLDKKDPISTEIEVITSQPLLQKTIDALKITDLAGVPIKAEVLKKQLKLKNIPGTDVLQISYKSSNPQEAAALVNNLMSLYIRENILTNRAEATLAREFIAKQLPTSEITVQKAEMALRHFKEKNQIISLEEEGKRAVEVIAELDQKISIAQSELANANARAIELRKRLGLDPLQAMSLIALTESSGVQQVLKELQNLEENLALEQSRYLDSTPEIVSLKAKEAAIKAVLQERISQIIGNKQPVDISNLQIGELKQKITYDFIGTETQRLGIAKELNALYKSKASYKKQLDNLPKLEQDQRELERRLKAAQSTYAVLLENLQEARVAENKNTSKARIIEPAIVPENPSNSKKIIKIALGIVVGFICGIAIIIILEIQDKSIKTPKEIKGIFKYTLLASIPALSQKKNIVLGNKNVEWPIPELPVLDKQHQQIAEIYRLLQVNLKFLSSEQALKVIVVTSAVLKEGKSTVSANLAVAIAQLGRKVLLVDANMRHPVQHQIWNINNTVGLSDVIVDQIEFEAAIQRGIDNLDVLTSGDIPFNPLSLLDSKRMVSLIEDFSQNYDFVIIDAPPLVVGVEALTLGKMTDGLLLVARPGIIDITSATTVKESLDKSKSNVLGLVINGTTWESQSDKYSYYFSPAPVQIKSKEINQYLIDDRKNSKTDQKVNFINDIFSNLKK